MFFKIVDGVKFLLSNLMLIDISLFEMCNLVSCNIIKGKIYFYFIILVLFLGNFSKFVRSKFYL